MSKLRWVGISTDDRRMLAEVRYKFSGNQLRVSR